jgi:hypothetical protein
MLIHPKLEVGRPFRLHPSCEDPDTYVALRVTDCSAIVRNLTRKEHVSLPQHGVEFERPGRPFTISAHAQVFYLPTPKEGEQA